MLYLDPKTARDLLDGFRLLEGRLRDSGRALSQGAIELRGIAERSVRVSTGQTIAAGSPVADDDPVLALLTYADVADRLQVSDSTVKRMVRAGNLKTVLVGSTPRIRPADLEAYIASLPTKETA